MRITHPAAGCGLSRTMTEGMPMTIDTRLLVGRLRDRPRRHMEAEEVPIGSRVRTPTGKEAIVEGYRGFRRDHIVRLVCRYIEPVNKRFDVVLLPPELVTVLVVGGE